MRVVIFSFSLFFSALAYACDPCALYQASRLQGQEEGTFYASVAEQYTSYKKAKNFQENSIRDGELVKSFSTTQFTLGYDLSNRQSLQVTLPLILREIEEYQTFRRNDELDVGLGDLILSSNYTIYQKRTSKDQLLLIGGTVGLKLPTGDTGSLETAANNSFVDPEQKRSGARYLKHHPIGSSSGGRALTMGTGSYDGVFGLNFVVREKRWLLMASAQYTLRTEGDFNYEFGDDFLIDVGPAYYFVLDDKYTAASRLALTGEFKDNDTLSGDAVEASSFSNLYLGPEILLTFSDSLVFSLGTDFRITDEDYSLTVVPDFRIRSMIGLRF